MNKLHLKLKMKFENFDSWMIDINLLNIMIECNKMKDYEIFVWWMISYQKWKILNLKQIIQLNFLSLKVSSLIKLHSSS